MILTTLNDDLWLRIFDALVQQDGSLALFTICSVNAYWRHLASCSPLLWMNVVVDRVEQLRSTTYIQRFISNSACAPLSITIDFLEHQFTADDPSRIVGALEAFKVCVTRMESLRITTRQYDLVVLIAEAMGKGQPAPMLHSLHIAVQLSTDDPDVCLDWLSTSFSPAPNLRHLTIPTDPLPCGPIVDSVLHSVPSLSISTSINHADTMPILDLIGRLGTSMERFHFYCDNIFTFSATHKLHYGGITTLPALTSIDVTATGSGTDILRNVSAPALRHVRLDGWRARYTPGISYWHDEDQMAVYISVTLQRTSVRSINISSLHLEYIDLDKPDEEFRCILAGEWFPHLEELVMKVLKITDMPFIAAASVTTPLKKLVLVKCRRVTPVGLAAFVGGRTRTFCLTLELPVGVAGDRFWALSDLCTVECY